jgi:arylsulfatase A-like enzyme
MHGRSMVPLLRGDAAADWRKDWYYEYYEYPGPHSVKKNRGIRTQQYKFIHYHEEPQEFELYDLSKDPEERNNLYGKPEYAMLVKQLQARMDELRRETGDK